MSEKIKKLTEDEVSEILRQITLGVPPKTVGLIHSVAVKRIYRICADNKVKIRTRLGEKERKRLLNLQRHSEDGRTVREAATLEGCTMETVRKFANRYNLGFVRADGQRPDVWCNEDVKLLESLLTDGEINYANDIRRNGLERYNLCQIRRMGKNKGFTMDDPVSPNASMVKRRITCII